MDKNIQLFTLLQKKIRQRDVFNLPLIDIIDNKILILLAELSHL